MDARDASRPSLSLASRSVLIAILSLLALIASDCTLVRSNDAGTRTLYLVRHGEYDDNDDNRDPNVGMGLVDLGRRQAHLVANRLASLPVQIDAIYTSPMTRARETAAIVAENFSGLDPVVKDDLAECIPPTYREDVMRDLEPKEGEHCREQLERAFSEFFAPPAEGDRHEILVFHGNAIRYLVGRAIGLDPKSWLNLAIANCSITEILVQSDGSAKLVTFNDVGHIPPPLQTFAGVGKRFPGHTLER